MRRVGVARAEREMLVAEIRRLLGIYGTNGSFRSYAEGLLAFVTPDDGERRYLHPPPARREGWECRSNCGLGLGQLAADAKPVPAGWALAWLRLHPKGWLRTPATRCPDEFNEMFTRRYRERFGGGLMLEPGGAFLGKRYRPASPGISSRHCRRPADPDVADLEAPLARLRELADEACDELDAYSRYLGGTRTLPGPLRPLALLPPGLEGRRMPPRRRCSAGPRIAWAPRIRVQVAASELLARWSAASAGKRTWKVRGGTPGPRPGTARHRDGTDVRFGGAAPAGQAPVVCSAARPRSSPPTARIHGRRVDSARGCSGLG